MPCQAFTLIELLVVVAIVAILIAILLPSLRQARTLTQRAMCMGNLRQVHVAVEMYHQDYRDTYPCAADPVAPKVWLWMGRGWRGLVEPYFDTAVSKDNPSALFCPEDPSNNYESTSYAYSMVFYHSPQQINAISDKAEIYYPAVPPASLPQREQDVAGPAHKLLIGEWTSNHEPVENDKGWWCWAGQRIFLLADGQVRPQDAKDILPARDGLPDANLTADGIQGRDVSH